jgi:Putative zinc-finger
MTEYAHPEESVLVSLADGELSRETAAEIERHLETCAGCSVTFHQLRGELAGYDRFHRETLKPQFPAPPRRWADLDPLLDLMQPAPKRRWRAPLLAIAASVLAGIVVVHNLDRPDTDDLLRRATAAESPTRPRPPLRFRTRDGVFVRPAVLIREAGDPYAGLRAKFVAARYSWEEPLSVRSYAAWRNQLSRKKQSVSASPEGYEIRTTTTQGPLVEATLALRAQDLHPVRGTLRFEPADVVEMSEVEESPALAAKPAAPGRSAPTPTPAAKAPELGLEDELRVIAALHAAGADLGEPIELRPEDGRMQVIATGMDARRQEQLRNALSTVPNVDLRFVQPNARPLATPAEGPAETSSRQPAPLLAELEARLGGRASVEQFIDSALQSSDAVMARAHALRNLAARFPPSAALSSSSRAQVDYIARDHFEALRARQSELRSILAAAIPSLVPPSGDTSPARRLSWYAAVDALFPAARRVDETLNALLAPGSRQVSARAQDLTNALRALDDSLAVSP